MKISLYSAIQTVVLPGEAKPPDRWLYAIIYRQGKEAGRGWLPEGYAAEDPSEELSTFMGTGGRNPLKVPLPDGRLLAHPDQYGEYFKLQDGSLAQVFNRDRSQGIVL
jgi:hypothetical protein